MGASFQWVDTNAESFRGGKKIKVCIQKIIKSSNPEEYYQTDVLEASIDGKENKREPKEFLK